MNGFIASLVLSLVFIGCPNKYHNLAVASDTAAHALHDIDKGINIAAESGVLSPDNVVSIKNALLQTATAGKNLDAAIRTAGATGASVQTQADAFKTALEQLRVQVDTITDKRISLSLDISITSAEGAIAIVEAWPAGSTTVAKP
jgi:indole-3-glycerol phosphate synthase